MPMVEISDKNFERLKRWARPLEDTVDDVLSRVLDRAESANLAPGVRESSKTRQVDPADEVGRHPPRNTSPLLAEFENWLQSHQGIRYLHSGKTMSTYALDTPRVKGIRQPKVFVPTTGNNRLYLPIDNYSPVDPDKRVIYKDPLNKEGRLIGWNIYPQFVARTSDDLKLAKELIEFALR